MSCGLFPRVAERGSLEKVFWKKHFFSTINILESSSIQIRIWSEPWSCWPPPAASSWASWMVPDGYGLSWASCQREYNVELTLPLPYAHGTWDGSQGQAALSTVGPTAQGGRLGEFAPTPQGSLLMWIMYRGLCLWWGRLRVPVWEVSTESRPGRLEIKQEEMILWFPEWALRVTYITVHKQLVRNMHPGLQHWFWFTNLLFHDR